MDVGNRRPQLPALSYLDVDKVKREEEAYQHQITGAPPSQTLPPVTAASPTYPYPSGPPPPYSQPTPASAPYGVAWPSGQQSVHTPPDSRRTSGDEHEAKQRQSLPSISEALGVESQKSYHATTTLPPQTQVSSHQPHAHSAGALPSLSPTSVKRYGMDPPPAPHAHPTLGLSPAYGLPQRQEHLDRPPLHVQTTKATVAPQQSTYSYAATTSPTYQQHPSAGSSETASFPYGYTPYPPRYAQPPPSSGSTSGPIYQPSSTYPAPQTSTTSWRSDPSAKYAANEPSSGPGDYSASVKRHLDLYDLEGALNEIASSSSILLDFSRRYGDRLHQTARAGTPLSTLPGTVEVNDMIQKSRSQVESLLKIREVVLAQQAAYDQQLAEQRPVKHASEPSPVNPEHAQDADESKAGFAGSDTKKRRGRAAPPGRCHSCNRAETPEWRRGPDGARTLCNACGLHYAKLTRKQSGANKGGANGASSNLRPKES